MHHHDAGREASGAIACAAILTFFRWTSVVIGSERRSSALPPSAITIRIGSFSLAGQHRPPRRVITSPRLGEGFAACG